MFPYPKSANGALARKLSGYHHQTPWSVTDSAVRAVSAASGIGDSVLQDCVNIAPHCSTRAPGNGSSPGNTPCSNAIPLEGLSS